MDIESGALYACQDGQQVEEYELPSKGSHEKAADAADLYMIRVRDYVFLWASKSDGSTLGRYHVQEHALPGQGTLDITEDLHTRI